MIFPLKASIMIKEREREREREREICRRCVIAISMVLIEVPDSIFNLNNIQKKKKKRRTRQFRKMVGASAIPIPTPLSLSLSTPIPRIFSLRRISNHTLSLCQTHYLSLLVTFPLHFSPHKHSRTQTHFSSNASSSSSGIFH